MAVATETKPRVAGQGIVVDGSWSFAGDVPRAFVDHVRCSVPGYDECHQLVCDVATFFSKPGCTVYELGTSTGELLRELAMRLGPTSRCIGVDIEPSMITVAKEHCAGTRQVELVCADVCDLDYEPADFIVSYLTLQFVSRTQRAQLLRTLRNSLKPGGGLFVFEKLRVADPRLSDLTNALYYDFKLGMGLSGDEIINKARSLALTMDAQTSSENIAMLRDAGFSGVEPICRHLCYEGYIALA